MANTATRTTTTYENSRIFWGSTALLDGMDVEGVHTTDRFHDGRSAPLASPRRDDRERKVGWVPAWSRADGATLATDRHLVFRTVIAGPAVLEAAHAATRTRLV